MITDYTTVFHFEVPTERLTPEAEVQLGAWLERKIRAEFERSAMRPALPETGGPLCTCCYSGWRVIHAPNCPAAAQS